MPRRDGNVGLCYRNPNDYVVSVLEMAGSAATMDEIIASESAWKVKAPKQGTGLNRN